MESTTKKQKKEKKIERDAKIDAKRAIRWEDKGRSYMALME